MTLLPEYHPWGALLADKGKVSRQSLRSPHQAAIYTLQIRPHTPAGFCSELSLGFKTLACRSILETRDCCWSSGGARQLRPREKQVQTAPVLVLDSHLTPHARKAISEDTWAPLVPPCFVTQELRNGGTAHVVSGTSDSGCASHPQAASNSVVRTEEDTLLFILKDKNENNC